MATGVGSSNTVGRFELFECGIINEHAGYSAGNHRDGISLVLYMVNVLFHHLFAFSMSPIISVPICVLFESISNLIRYFLYSYNFIESCLI